MGKKFKGKTCVYCGGSSSTGDHVVARAFFPEELRGDLPQVPACLSCNNKKSDLETYLVAVLPIAGNHAAANRLFDDARRRIQKNARLMREMAKGFEVYSPVSTEDAHATFFRGSQLIQYAAYVGRGLLYHHFGTVLGPEHEAKGLAIDALGQRRFDVMFEHLRHVASMVSNSLAGGALAYRGFVAADDSQVSAWQVRLYGGVNLGTSSTGYKHGTFDFAAMTTKKGRLLD
ncbi:hypothetical protein RKE25_19770 [Dyella sp. BiH032]|uniref:HNH endonuclease n=1 Tax=Dyella sp. BiH032 TaxID=3075430 RepID=UPI002892DBE6|nr:hypothetical protein [Dyella sp. BiH032]WNL45625.1 hypothetical protein RKE25_19770 [Dyella sp. BiH032]